MTAKRTLILFEFCSLVEIHGVSIHSNCKCNRRALAVTSDPLDLALRLSHSVGSATETVQSILDTASSLSL